MTRTYALMAAVTITITRLFSISTETTALSPFTVREPVDTIYFITGSNCSPNSTRISAKCCFALSSSACTVEFWTLYSFTTDVPSMKAWFAPCCSLRTLSTLPARAEITLAASAPERLILSSTGAILSIPPSRFNASRKVSTASLASLLINCVNSSTCSPANLAYLAGS